jgi:hypothetical protein
MSRNPSTRSALANIALMSDFAGLEHRWARRARSPAPAAQHDAELGSAVGVAFATPAVFASMEKRRPGHLDRTQRACMATFTVLQTAPSTCGRMPLCRHYGPLLVSRFRSSLCARQGRTNFGIDKDTSKSLFLVCLLDLKFALVPIPRAGELQIRRIRVAAACGCGLVFAVADSVRYGPRPVRTAGRPDPATGRSGTIDFVWVISVAMSEQRLNELFDHLVDNAEHAQRRVATAMDATDPIARRDLELAIESLSRILETAATLRRLMSVV